jgi:serine/threonine protein phosphatase PrpC
VTTRLAAGAATDVGMVRTENQDHLLVQPGLWLVADGMGGHRGGEVASLVATEVVASGVADLGPSRIDDAVRRANGAVIDRALGDPDLAGMGTTLTAIALVPAGDGADADVLALVNVGDSRTYRLAAGGSTIEQLTVDHSLVAEWEREGRITAEQAATHPHRNVITRALGIDDDVAVDRWDLTPAAGDRYLLCSDGLTNELDDDAIASVLVTFADPQTAAEELVAQANAAGGRDNVTVVVVDVVASSSGAGSVVGAPAAAAAGAAAPAGGLVAAGGPTAAGRAGAGGSATPAGAARSRFTWRVALFLVALVALVGLTAGAVVYFARGAYFVGAGGDDGAVVVVFQGRPGGVLWFQPTVVEATDLEVADLPMPERQRVEEGQVQPTLDDARRYLDTLEDRVASSTTTSTTTPPVTTTSTTVPSPAPTVTPGA